MAEFTPITTQEQLDHVIGDRIRKANEAAEKKFEGWTSPDALQKIQDAHASKIKELEDEAAAVRKTIEEKDTKIAEGEKYRTDLAKTRIALAAGLKMEYADRLRGENEEDWKEDAEILAKDFRTAHTHAPLGDPGPHNNDPHNGSRMALKKTLAGLRGE